MNKTAEAKQGVKQWRKMNDFFPSDKDKKEFEISFQGDVDFLHCPTCKEIMQRVFVRAGDTPIFSGWGPCRCEPKQ